MNRPPRPELLMNIQVTDNELKALNLAMGYFQRHCKSISPVYPEVMQLLAQFQRRLKEQLPAVIQH